MQVMKLMITSRSEAGSVHATLEIDGNDTGTLYLTSDELGHLTKIIQSGVIDDDIRFGVEDSFDCNQVIDEDPWED